MRLLLPKGTLLMAPRNEHNQKRLALCLVLIAGYLDGYGLLVLGTYVSFMSGNTTMAGVRAGQANFLAAFYPVIAIMSFVSGSLVGNVMTHSRLRHAHRILFGLIVALLIIVLQLGSHGAFKNVSIALLSFGTGMVNPILSQIGAESVSLTFMTGTLSKIGSHLALALRRAPVPASEGPWDSHFYRARIDAQLWAAFVLGSALSGIIISFATSFALVPAIAIMIVLALLIPPASPSR
jgi:uncharacterized membrane protein YoaK (UPF0700 family)